MTWVALLLHLFSLGVLAAVVAVPFREIGRYYFKFHATVALVPVVIAVMVGQPWAGLADGPLMARVAAGGAFLFAAVVLLENFIVRAARNDLRIDALLLPVSVGVPFVAVACFDPAGHGVGAALLLAFHLLTAAAVLGGALVAMTTGHWYLSNAKLSFSILVRLCLMLVGALALKTLAASVYVALRWAEYWAQEPFYLLVMGVRTGAGLVLAMVLALMSLSCARRRANQSATGILYVAVVFVLIGETISLYLTLGRGTPI